MRKWLFRICISLVIFLLLDINFILLYKLYYQNKIYHGVKIGNLALGGLTRADAFKKISQEISLIYGNGATFTYHGATLKIPIFKKEEGLPFVKPSKGVTFHITKTIDQGFVDITIGNNFAGISDQQFSLISNFLNSNINIYKLLVDGYDIKPVYEMNDQAIANQLKEYFHARAVLPENAKLVVSFVDKKPIVAISPEILGSSIEVKAAFNQLKFNLQNFTNDNIVIASTKTVPEILSKDAVLALEQAQGIMSIVPITLNITGTTTKKSLDSKTLSQFLEFKKIDNNITIGLTSKFKDDYLMQLSRKIKVESQDAVLKVVDDKVVAFGFAKPGLELDIDSSFNVVASEVIQKRNRMVNLTTKIIQPRVTDSLINDFGIKEIIGVGKSNFNGSPKNRRHNIALGAKTVNGIIIKPGDTFSLVEKLGDIEEKTGYLSELVIKGDRTIPEFGGGLCQIGTTIFRATLDSGLPVMERKNHSFRVIYYEPAGVDATIYNPRPDYKFKNDTGNNILIQTKIIGSNLFFEFWGTKDGRTIEQIKPKVYNIVKPLPVKIIETIDLPPGQKKCVEKATNGADAEFDYTVTYKDGKIVTKKFKSHYKPWRAICLVGKKIASEVSAEEISPESANRQLKVQ